MSIECIPSAERRGVVSIYFNGMLWRSIHTSIFGKKPSFPKQCANEAEFSELFTALEYRAAKNYLLRRLAAQQISSHLASKSLRQKLVAESVIERLIAEFQENGYINDQQWIDGFVRAQSSKRKGPRAIAYQLASKGVSFKEAEEALQENCSLEIQSASIQKLLKTRYSKKNLADFKERGKIIASLQRRGFDLQIIFNVIEDELKNI